MRKGKTTKPLNNVAHEIGSLLVVLMVSISSLLTVTQAHAAGSVALNLSATIDSSCSLERNDTNVNANAGGVDQSAETVALDQATGSITLNFNVNCNTPFKYSLTSTNGALVNNSGLSTNTTSDTIMDQVDYKTTFTATLEDYGSGDDEIDQTCESESLVVATSECTSGEAFADSGTGVAIDKPASLTISIDNFSNGLIDGKTPLLSGTFQDTLVLEVETPI
jgi:hypothetical protein